MRSPASQFKQPPNQPPFNEFLRLPPPYVNADLLSVTAVRRSLAFSLVDSYLGVALQLGSTLIISRLLSPTDIGIYSVAAVLAALASTFRDFGVAEYLIQEKDLTTAKIRAAFAANIIVSWLMALLLFGASSAVADFYREPGVADVMRIQSINFLLIPFGAVTIAYFRRELNYRPIFIGSLLANITGFLVATIAALKGFGYMSLAWSSLAGVVVNVVASILMRPKEFPRLPSFSGLAEVARFGKHASGIYLFGQIGKSAPEAVVGRALDMPSVAFFSRANGLLEIFNKTVMRAVLPVCLPYFSQAARSGQGTASGYLKATSLLTGIGWPFFLFIGLVAFSAIRLLYGPQWMQSVPLTQILCLAAVLELPYYLTSEVMIAEGRIDQSNRLQFFVQGLRLASLMLVFPFGLVGACWGLVGAAFVGAAVSHQFLHRIIGIRFSDVVQTLAPSLGVSLFSILPIAIIFLTVKQSESNYLTFLVGCSATMLIFWVTSLKVFNHPFWIEILAIANKAKRSVFGK
jgi:O-antigen/teichoic acid export membrane protein